MLSPVMVVAPEVVSLYDAQVPVVHAALANLILTASARQTDTITATFLRIGFPLCFASKTLHCF